MTERKRKLDVYDNGTTGFSSQPPPLRAGVNPFTGRPYSARYFDILIEAQRQAASASPASQLQNNFDNRIRTHSSARAVNMLLSLEFHSMRRSASMAPIVRQELSMLLHLLNFGWHVQACLFGKQGMTLSGC